MNIDSAADIDAGEIPTVQVLGAGILAQAIELLLVSSAAVTVVREDARVVLLIGNEGQNQLRHGRHAGKRRRREHFVLLTSAQDIDYRLVREAPIEVFVGTDESVATLVQGLTAASRSEAFCSQQLVPALIAAAVNSASPPERTPLQPQSPETRRPAVDRSLKKHTAPKSLSASDSADPVDEAASPRGEAPPPEEDEESLVSQELRTLHLAIALGLSEREAEVAIEAVKGFSNTEIGELLNMSVPTIKYHLYQAYQKLGIHRRSQLAAALFLPASDE